MTLIFGCSHGDEMAQEYSKSRYSIVAVLDGKGTLASLPEKDLLKLNSIILTNGKMIKFKGEKVLGHKQLPEGDDEVTLVFWKLDGNFKIVRHSFRFTSRNFLCRYDSMLGEWVGLKVSLDWKFQ
jgi:hypothetical protein